MVTQNRLTIGLTGIDPTQHCQRLTTAIDQITLKIQSVTIGIKINLFAQGHQRVITALYVANHIISHDLTTVALAVIGHPPGIATVIR